MYFLLTVQPYLPESEGLTLVIIEAMMDDIAGIVTASLQANNTISNEMQILYAHTSTEECWCDDDRSWCYGW